MQVANNDIRGHERYLQRSQQRRSIYEKENKIIPFEDYDYAYLESKIKNYETIVQTPVDYEESLRILDEVGLRVDYITGRETDIMWLGGQKIR